MRSDIEQKNISPSTCRADARRIWSNRCARIQIHIRRAEATSVGKTDHLRSRARVVFLLTKQSTRLPVHPFQWPLRLT